MNNMKHSPQERENENVIEYLGLFVKLPSSELLANFDSGSFVQPLSSLLLVLHAVPGTRELLRNLYTNGALQNSLVSKDVDNHLNFSQSHK